METNRFQYRFNIGDIVYYNLPEGDAGIVVDVTYSVNYNEVRYTVSFGRDSNDQTSCSEVELLSEKRIV